MNTFRSMIDLLEQVPSHGNYTFQIDKSRNSHVKLFAPHGGCIEPCTGKLVLAIAQDKYDYFIFNGMRKINCYRMLHVSSIYYDEPLCRKMAEDAVFAIAFHGCDGEESFIEIGGGNVYLSNSLLQYLDKKGYPVRLAQKNRKGVDERNIINRAQQKGVQLELSAGFRKSLYVDFPKTIQPNQVMLRQFVQSMKYWLHNNVSMVSISEESYS